MREIVTDGYRGPRSDFQYLPAGTYTLGDRLDVVGRVVPPALAAYLVGIDKAEVVTGVPEPEPETAPAAETEGPALEDLTVAELRELAARAGVDPAGLRKADLVGALRAQAEHE